jgi:iron complex outermembrane receptor protein
MNATIRKSVLVLSLLLPATAFAQQDSTVEWRLSLQDLARRLAGVSNGDAAEAWRADAEALRSSLAFFAAGHADIRIAVPDPLPEKPSVDAFQPQLDKLTAAVDEVIRQSPTSPFHLGSVAVTVSAPSSAPSLVSDRIGEAEIEQHNFLNIARAFDYMPGVEIQHIANNRNEAGIMVRGFTTRGQIPFYLDGIPISVPYDGYVDFNRFLTGGLAELEVDKGYVSPLLGPNALGGAINIVTKEPTKSLDGNVTLGAASGGTAASSVGLGTRTPRFFAQGSYDRVRVDDVPLSGDFQVHQYTGLPDVTMTDRLNRSATLDDRYGGRAGWTPRAGDEYVISFTNQHGEKGVPLY